MNALTFVFTALCVFAMAYRFYGLFIAKKVLSINPDRKTPAVAMEDGHDYHETDKYVLFGHHFAAIAATPLLGPVLAAQFGFLPGALWIIVGAVVAGAIHDMVILFASVRHEGKSLSLIAESEIGKRAGGTIASFAILFILILTLAGLSIAVVNAMFSSPWGSYTVICTIPIALLMGVYMQMIRPGDIKGGSVIGVILLALTFFTGPYAAANPALASMFTFTKHQLSVFIPIYGFIASALPVWLLLCPRDYLSTYLKLGTIAALTIGIFVVHPQMNMAAVTKYVHGGGPVIPGALFPFLFITIACGALSGFHAIIGTGTTPKMIANERDILFVGLRGHAGGRVCGHHGAGGRLRPGSGRLLCHQCGSQGLRGPQAGSGSPAAAGHRRGRNPAGKTGRCRFSGGGDGLPFFRSRL